MSDGRNMIAGLYDLGETIGRDESGMGKTIIGLMEL